MTMHLEGPWLTTTGKVRSKRRKFASAEAARKARELQAEWERRQVEWAKLAPRFSSNKTQSAPRVLGRLTPQYPPGREPQHIPSRDTGGFAPKAPDKFYTGTKIKGIGTMHKSNAVPIFSDDEAVDIAHMRR